MNEDLKKNIDRTGYASDLETRIRAQKSNLAFIDDPLKRKEILITMIGELLSIVGTKDEALQDKWLREVEEVVGQRNTKYQNSMPLDRLGWNIIDERAGISVPTPSNSRDQSLKDFKILQSDYVNAKLVKILTKVSTWMEKQGIFDYKRPSDPEIYDKISITSRIDFKPNDGNSTTLTKKE